MNRHISLILIALVLTRFSIGFNPGFCVGQSIEARIGALTILTSFETDIGGYDSAAVGFTPTAINFWTGFMLQLNENNAIGYMHQCKHGVDQIRYAPYKSRHRFVYDIFTKD